MRMMQIVKYFSMLMVPPTLFLGASFAAGPLVKVPTVHPSHVGEVHQQLRIGDKLNEHLQTYEAMPLEHRQMLAERLFSYILACEEKTNPMGCIRTKFETIDGKWRYMIIDNASGVQVDCADFDKPDVKLEVQALFQSLGPIERSNSCSVPSNDYDEFLKKIGVFNPALNGYSCKSPAAGFQECFGQFACKALSAMSLAPGVGLLANSLKVTSVIPALGGVLGSAATTGTAAAVGAGVAGAGSLVNNCITLGNGLSCAGQAMGMLANRAFNNVANLFHFFVDSYKSAAVGVGSALSNIYEKGLNGLWESTKNAVSSFGQSIVSMFNAGSLFSSVTSGAVEDKTSYAAHLASQQSDGVLAKWAKNPSEAAVDILKFLYELAFVAIPPEMGCQKWSGVPYLSSCEVTGVEWKCANCQARSEMLCQMVGMFGADLMGPALVLGHAPKLFQKIAQWWNKIPGASGAASRVGQHAVNFAANHSTLTKGASGLLTVAKLPYKAAMGFAHSFNLVLENTPILGKLFRKINNIQGMVGGGYKSLIEYETLVSTSKISELAAHARNPASQEGIKSAILELTPFTAEKRLAKAADELTSNVEALLNRKQKTKLSQESVDSLRKFIHQNAEKDSLPVFIQRAVLDHDARPIIHETLNAMPKGKHQDAFTQRYLEDAMKGLTQLEAARPIEHAEALLDKQSLEAIQMNMLDPKTHLTDLKTTYENRAKNYETVQAAIVAKDAPVKAAHLEPILPELVALKTEGATPRVLESFNEKGYLAELSPDQKSIIVRRPTVHSETTRDQVIRIAAEPEKNIEFKYFDDEYKGIVKNKQSLAEEIARSAQPLFAGLSKNALKDVAQNFTSIVDKIKNHPEQGKLNFQGEIYSGYANDVKKIANETAKAFERAGYKAGEDFTWNSEGTGIVIRAADFGKDPEAKLLNTLSYTLVGQEVTLPDRTTKARIKEVEVNADEVIRRLVSPDSKPIGELGFLDELEGSAASGERQAKLYIDPRALQEDTPSKKEMWRVIEEEMKGCKK